MNSYVDRRYEFIEQMLHMNSYVCIRYEFIDKKIYEFIGNNNVRGHTFSVVLFAFLPRGAFFACTALRLDDFFPHLDDGIFPALHFVRLANGEADSSEDRGDGAIAVFALALAFLAGAFFPVPRFVRCPQPISNSSASAIFSTCTSTSTCLKFCKFFATP
jgi:hypothetical protein